MRPLETFKVSARQQKTSEAGFFCPAYVGLRAVLLLAVLEGHYWSDATRDDRLHILTFAVPCFFVLSGYLISHTLFQYEDRPWMEAARAFYVRRALRILPPFYLVLGVAWLAYGMPFLVWQATYTMNIKIFILSAFEPRHFLAYLVSGAQANHFWSVDVEEQFYLLYPLFVAATFRYGRTAGLWAGIAAGILCRLYLIRHYPESFYGGLTPVAGEYILWGCLLAWMDHRGRWLWLRGSRPMFASLLIFVTLAWSDQSYGGHAQWRPPLHATVYAVLLAVFVMALRYSPSHPIYRFLCWKPLIPIGKVSYGAYLVHGFLNPAVDTLLRWLPFLEVFPRCPRALAGPLVTLAVAGLLWYGFERPIDNLRQRVRPPEDETARTASGNTGSAEGTPGSSRE